MARLYRGLGTGRQEGKQKDSYGQNPFHACKNKKNTTQTQNPFLGFLASVFRRFNSTVLLHHQLEPHAVYVLDVNIGVVLEVLAQFGDVDVH